MTRPDDPRHLVGTEWLAARLHDPRLRVLDCTTYLVPDPALVYRIESGRPNWERGHIPGAVHVDVETDLSDKTSSLRFTVPSAPQVAAVMSRLGVEDGTQVVLYSADNVWWATRVWWILRAYGFDAAAVLDGGFRRWQAEGRPIATEPDTYPAARFTARPRPELIARKADVVAAIPDRASCIINALTPEQHRGESPIHYGRPGRIAGSVNVPALHLVDRASGRFLPPDALAARFTSVGADDATRILTYCGSGIAATADAFALSMLGFENVAVYDGSLFEWVRDPALPMETGPPLPAGPSA